MHIARAFLKIVLLLAIINCGSATFIHRQVPGHRVKLTEEETDELDRAHRNAICCTKKLRCCNPKPPDIEIRAVITRCPNRGTDPSIISRTLNKVIYPSQERKIKEFQGFDEDELMMQTDIVDCARKLLLTMNIKNEGMTNCKNQFVVVDHVFDPISEKSVRILNPYVIKIKQESVSQTYPLEFRDYVNSEAREQVFNKHDGNFTGCSTHLSNATCGVVRYHGKAIPYSQGFCCSCDAVVNALREPDSESISPIIALSDPAYLLDNVHCARNFFRDSNKYKYYERKRASADIRKRKEHAKNYYNAALDRETSPRLDYEDVATNRREKRLVADNQSPAPKSFDVNKHLDAKRSKQIETYLMHLSDHGEKSSENYLNKIKSTHRVSKHDLSDNAAGIDLEKRTSRKKRQVLSSGVQRRGGQNCADRYTPPGKDPDSYHESAHCLRFSDLWYAVYNVGKPEVAQTIYFEVYVKLIPECGDQGRWQDLTRTRVKLGTFEPAYINEYPSTISMKFTSKFQKDISNNLFRLDQDARLLIPETSNNCEQFVEAKGGPEEYLILQPHQVEFNGFDCDKVGVGFEAFFKQNKRCAMQRGTCLQNQPKQLWRHDKKLDKKGLKGCYFLKNYASIPPNPIRKNSTSGKNYLALKYPGEHLSIIDMEINADFNAIIRPQSSAVITEVYIDSTKPSTTTLTVKVTNAGLLSNHFMIRISDIPLEMADSFQALESSIVLISPQNQHIFKLESTNLALPVDIFYCSIEVLSPKRELLALRRIRIQMADRCICTWHCLCACVGSSEGLKCRPMSLQHYHAAGFQGSLPMVTYMEHYTLMDDVLSVIMYLLLFLAFTLILLGFTKAVIGLCSTSIGSWGLNVLLDLPKPLNEYYERSLRGYQVVYDEENWPVHPETGERVRNIGCLLMFLINIFFFFTYPPTVTGVVMRRLCCPKSKKKYGQVHVCTDADCANKNMFNDQEVEVVMQVSEFTDASNVMRRRHPISKEETIFEEVNDEEIAEEEEDIEVASSRKSSAFKPEYKSSMKSTSKGATTEDGSEEEDPRDRIAQPAKGTQYNIDARTTSDTSRSTSPTNLSRECVCDHGSSM